MSSIQNFSFIIIDKSSMDTDVQNIKLKTSSTVLINKLERIDNNGMVIIDKPDKKVYVVTNEDTPAKIKFTASYFSKIITKTELGTRYKTIPISSEEMRSLIHHRLNKKNRPLAQESNGTKEVKIKLSKTQTKQSEVENLSLGKVRKGQNLILAIKKDTVYTPMKISSSVFGKTKIETVFSPSKTLEDGVFKEKGMIEITVKNKKVDLIRVIRETKPRKK
ncbi:MAG: hypothetical protein ACTSUV_06205 [Candidatus Ranarchaeia archaeon]